MGRYPGGEMASRISSSTVKGIHMRVFARRSAAAIAAAAVLAGGVVGCSSSDANETTPSSTTSTQQATVTIVHRAGTTELSSVPTKIFVADDVWMDSLLAFDVQPVGYDIGPRDGDAPGALPWQTNLSKSAKELYGKDGAPFEQIAALDPDLILGYNYETTDVYNQLNAIAPTIGIIGAAEMDPWEDRIRAVGKILHRESDGEKIIASTNDSIKAVATELPGLDGKTAVLGKYFAANGQVGLVADPDDGTSKVFAQLGMTVPQQLIDMAAAGGASGRVLVSPEQIDVISADVVVLGATQEDIAKLPGFDQLPSVRTGGMAVVNDTVVAAFNLPSSLSIPWAIGQIKPSLQAAAK